MKQPARRARLSHERPPARDAAVGPQRRHHRRPGHGPRLDDKLSVHGPATIGATGTRRVPPPVRLRRDRRPLASWVLSRQTPRIAAERRALGDVALAHAARPRARCSRSGGRTCFDGRELESRRLPNNARRQRDPIAPSRERARRRPCTRDRSLVASGRAAAPHERTISWTPIARSCTSTWSPWRSASAPAPCSSSASIT